MLNFLIYHTPFFYLIQSIWRDEAFSYFMSLPPLVTVIRNTAHDFNPPLYYLLLHYWILLVGKSDIGIRLLSFFPHIGSTYISFLFAQKFFSNRFAWFVAVFTFFNPMLLYYGFEMRMYSYYALFTFATVYFLYERKWKWYIVSAVLGLYTHSFFPLILLSFILYFVVVKHSGRKILLTILLPFLFYLPWIPILLNQFLRSKDSWIFPADLQLIKSVLGNIFTSFEGTPGGLWPYTAWLSLLICIFLLSGLLRKREKALFFIMPLIIPLVIVLGYSVFKRPIFVNRYMIFVAVFEIFGISYGIWTIKNRLLRNITAGLWLGLIIFINIYLTPFHKKTDFKMTFREINSFATKKDFVYTKTPISLLESAFYYSYPEKVSILNPNNIAIPSYIGTTVVFPHASQTSLPPAPSRTFLISDDASYEMVISQ